MADSELDRGGRRRFARAFSATMHADGASDKTSRKKSYVAGVAAAVAVSAGIAVAVGTAGTHKTDTASGPARPSARTLSAASTHAAETAASHAVALPAPSSVADDPSYAQYVDASDSASGPPEHVVENVQPGILTGGAGPAPAVTRASSSVSHAASGKRVSTPQTTSTASTPRVTASTASTPRTTNTSRPVEEAPAQASVPTPPTSYKVTGQLSCSSGNAVEGVWVQANDGADWASWKPLSGGSVADWWLTLPEDESYSLNVGCGGSPENWKVSVSSPTVTGQHNSFNCYDQPDGPHYRDCLLRLSARRPRRTAPPPA